MSFKNKNKTGFWIHINSKSAYQKVDGFTWGEWKLYWIINKIWMRNILMVRKSTKVCEEGNYIHVSLKSSLIIKVDMFSMSMQFVLTWHFFKNNGQGYKCGSVVDGFPICLSARGLGCPRFDSKQWLREKGKTGIWVWLIQNLRCKKESYIISSFTVQNPNKLFHRKEGTFTSLQGSRACKRQRMGHSVRAALKSDLVTWDYFYFSFDTSFCKMSEQPP